jgi:hypothetical protein
MMPAWHFQGVHLLDFFWGEFIWVLQTIINRLRAIK